MKKIYEKLVKRLSNDSMDTCTSEDAFNLANEVLKIGGYENIIGATPIVKIAEEFGFKILKARNMPDDISGNIFIGGGTYKAYKANNVIVVGANEVLFHQRFIIAHELGHFLMDYLGSDISKDDSQLFEMAYKKNNHNLGDNSKSELRADVFAAEILMPRKEFRKRYTEAMDESFHSNIYTLSFLSHYFRTKESSIRRRIQEVIL